MKWTPKLLPLSIVLAAGVPLTGYALAGKTVLAIVLLALGVWWLLGVHRRWLWLGGLCATCILLILMTGSLSNLSPAWLLVGMLSLLAAWDLEQFRHRYYLAERIEAGDDLERRHLGQLAVILGVGGGLAGLALVVRLHLNFAVAVLLTLLAAFGLSRLVARLRRQSD